MNHRLSEAAQTAVQQLAKTLGVPELRCGRQALRDHRGWLDDEIEVDYSWHALVMPSFHPWAAIGLVRMGESEFRGKKHPASIRAAVVLLERERAQAQQSAAAELASDPLAKVIGGVELLPELKSICLDGIGYRVCTSDYEIDATLQIRNPRTASLRAVEAALFLVAQTVQEQSQNEELTAYLASWRRYIEESLAP